jgi:hypothetical protein
MRFTVFAIAVAIAASLALSPMAQAQTTKGAGKTSLTIIKYPVGNIQAKAAGSIASKPAASLAGKPPTGGATTSLKLAKDVGNPLVPGYGAGEYILDIETGATPDGNVAVHAYVALTVDAAFKCTVHAAATVDGSTADCNMPPSTTEPICAPIPAGKCSFTTYQAAGIPNYTLGPGDGQPTASRLRLRINSDPANCHTGDITLAGIPAPVTSTCSTAAGNTVVGVMGVANGQITVP